MTSHSSWRAESALVFSSGYMSNLAVVTALAGRDSLILSDLESHASLVDACRLSRARIEIFDRTNLEHIERTLAVRPEGRAIVVTDRCSAPVVTSRRCVRCTICVRYSAVLVVDEAHGLGVRGPRGQGLVHEVGLSGAPDVVVTATLSKAPASQGGVVLGPDAVRGHLIDVARPFIFDTGLAPGAVEAASAALEVLREEPEHVVAVRDALLVWRQSSAQTFPSRPSSPLCWATRSWRFTLRRRHIRAVSTSGASVRRPSPRVPRDCV